ncbi:TPA: ead/Ea22-like family protein, partial [Citrobacter amalonaticus]|nr:ead/Ea22-like family protein [Citrobacter amalonaticus]HCC6296840.1 ead/Ea22-like family protein [Citrobacter amalonaticus]HCC6433226.1 ead/Ea22-like family protein [Citrobacter amalonaticus]HCC7018892.1 ead/Ea22-like family protein [Citrobacter amalonaticus]
MSNIDKRALREAAEKATPGRIGDRIDGSGSIKYRCVGYDGSLVLLTDHKNMEYGFVGDNGDADELFFRLCVPDVVLALLDELDSANGYASAYEAEKWHYHGLAECEGERADRAEKALVAAEKRNAELEGDKSRMMDALHSAVALNSAGISLNDFDECVSRLHECGALPDYCIALYVDFIHGYVSENKLLDFGFVNDNGAFSLRQAEKRIAELEARTVDINLPERRDENYDWDGATPTEAFNTCISICSLMFSQS